jgi:hypothetical protein
VLGIALLSRRNKALVQELGLVTDAQCFHSMHVNVEQGSRPVYVRSDLRLDKEEKAHGNHGLSRVGCGNCFSAKTHSLMESDHIGLVRVCVAEWTQREGSLYSIRAEGADLAGCPSLASEKLEY